MPLSSFVSTSTWEREIAHHFDRFTMGKNEFEALTGLSQQEASRTTGGDGIGMAVDLGSHHSTGVVLVGGSAHDSLFRIGIVESISILPTHLASRVSSSVSDGIRLDTANTCVYVILFSQQSTVLLCTCIWVYNLVDCEYICCCGKENIGQNGV